MLSPAELDNLGRHIHDIDVKRMSISFDALSEPNRCLMFRALLRGQRLQVGDMARLVGVSLPLASQHLKVLLQADLVSRRREGKNVYYDINGNNPMMGALQEAVEG